MLGVISCSRDLEKSSKAYQAYQARVRFPAKQRHTVNHGRSDRVSLNQAVSKSKQYLISYV